MKFRSKESCVGHQPPALWSVSRRCPTATFSTRTGGTRPARRKSIASTMCFGITSKCPQVLACSVSRWYAAGRQGPARRLKSRLMAGWFHCEPTDERKAISPPGAPRHRLANAICAAAMEAEGAARADARQGCWEFTGPTGRSKRPSAQRQHGHCGGYQRRVVEVTPAGKMPGS